MPLESRPRYPVPRGRQLKNSVKHHVKDGESWDTLAKKYRIPAENIIYANFNTLAPREVNWYLRHYVGCRKATVDGNNWMFSSAASPGIIQIPPQVMNFNAAKIVGTSPPRFYSINEPPSKWTPPGGMADGGASAKKVVSMAPWRHGALNVGKLSVKGRTQWGGGEPIWKNELVYYNKVAYPLENTFKTIIIHHTNNTDSIDAVEKKQQSKGYAAIGYAFFIAQSGVIYEGRPLEIMGSNAGQGLSSGPLNDPDWGSVGIALQGDFEHETFDFNDDDVTTKQLQAMEDLVVALRGKYGINKLIMHREVKRKGKATVCPGSHLVPHVEALRKKIGISGP